MTSGARVDEMDEAEERSSLRTQVAEHPHTQAREGVLFGVLAYAWWGLIPLYFKTVDHVPPLEVLAHRVVWSCLLLVGVLTVAQRWKHFGRVLRNRSALSLLAATTLLIAANWFTYIYAIDSRHVLQASLGYFITPLANVLLGVVFLGERIRRWQWGAVGIALVGVVTLAAVGGEFPWIALLLATTFSFYGLLRKQVEVDGLTALFVETLLLFPLAAGSLALFHITGNASFRIADPATNGLLMLSGLVTAIPLISFAAAARRLRMATLGFLQYLAPSIQFLLAVVGFGEPFSGWQIVSFACIWGAILIYSLDSLLPRKRASERGGFDLRSPLAERPAADATDGS